MGRDKTIIFIALAVIALGLMAWFWVSNTEKPKHNWRENYKNDNKDPYGTYVISEMLEKYFDGKKFNVMRKPIHEGLPRHSQNASYIFIGSGMYLDSLSEGKLLEFVNRGNNAFISVPNIPYFIEDTLNLATCDYYYSVETQADSTADLNFYDPSFKTEKPYPFFYRYISDTLQYNWYYFGDTCLNSAAVYLGNMDDSLANYARIPFGKGNFYIHTAPLAFTNFQLVNKRSLEYAGKVFSYIPEGDIYWDEFSKIPIEFKYEDDSKGGNLRWEKSPLYFILSQPALQFAWYLFLALVLLFILFRAKRRQRVIPLLVPNSNTSLEFAETIGRIYYLQNDHRKLAAQKMKLFLEGIRNRYSIPTNTLDTEFIQKLSQKSQVPQKEIERILDNYTAIGNLGEVSETVLINFNNAIDNFYKKAK